MADVMIPRNSIAVITRYYNGMTHKIIRKHKIVREYISKGVVRIDHVWTNGNLTTLLTKRLSREKVNNTSNMMRLMHIDN